MTLLFDENVPIRIVHALRLCDGVTPHHILDHLPPGASDEDVFALAKRLGASIVSWDWRMARKPQQVAAFKAAGASLFLFTGRSQIRKSINEQIVFVIRALEVMRREQRQTRGQFVVAITDQLKPRRLS